MCNSEGCSERAQVLADETDQGREAAGRSGSGAARVVPVERLEELAAEFEDARTTDAPDSWSRGYNAAIGVLTRRLRFVANRDATTVDPETTRSGFTGATESDGTAPEAPEGGEAGERRREPQGGDSVEQAARALHAWDVEGGPCAGPWEALTDAQREVWRSGAQALADHGLLVPDDYPSNPEGSWRPRAERAEAEARAAEQEADRLRERVGSCLCDTADPDGPDETCPQHGLTYAQWVQRSDTAEQEAERLRDRVADLEAEVENWRKAHDWAHEQWAKKRDTAEARARRAEDALRFIRDRASSVDFITADAWNVADRALTAADQTSDTTPSDTTTTEEDTDA